MNTKAINGDDTRCLIWMGDLIDTGKLIGTGENLYIRVNRLSGIVSCFSFSALLMLFSAGLERIQKLPPIAPHRPQYWIMNTV